MKVRFSLRAPRHPHDVLLQLGSGPVASARPLRRLALPLLLLFFAQCALRAQSPAPAGQPGGASAPSLYLQGADLEDSQYAPAKPHAYGPPLTAQAANPQPAPAQTSAPRPQRHTPPKSAPQQFARQQSTPPVYADPQPSAQKPPEQELAQVQPYPQPEYAQPQSAPPEYAEPYARQPRYAQPQYAQQPYPAQQPQYAESYPPDSSDPNDPMSGPGPQPQQPAAQPFSADQLEQLVAPIALYPDALLAQILAAATYPAQVVGADHWLQSLGNAPADQVAAGADAQAWDPSVKALTAFPQVLAQLDQNLQWTTDLGNAYFNQPQDVMATVQLLRQRAQSAGNLQDTPQEQVSDDQGNLELAPPDPGTVYVPVYNPWDVYGAPLAPYPGYAYWGSYGPAYGYGPIRFGFGIAMAAFDRMAFGWLGWGLDWFGHGIFFNHQHYYSHSTTVARWGGPRGGYAARAGLSRGSEGYGRSQGYPQRGYAGGQGYAANRGYSNFARPSIQNNYAYNRMPTRPQQSYARPGYGYGGQGYAARPGGYAYGQQGARAPAYAAQRPQQFAQRSYASPMGRGFAGYGGGRPYAGGGGQRSFGSGARSFGGGGRSYGGGGRSFGGGGGGHFGGGGGHFGGGHSGGGGGHRR
jgi:hypothetical protein